MRRRAGPTALLGLFALVFAAWLVQRALTGGAWSLDEQFFVQLTRVLAEHFPEGLWSAGAGDYSARGIQRLLQVVLLVPLTVVTGVPGLVLARILVALVWVSAAVPALLLLRGLGVGRRWAAFGAALCVLVPWAVLAESFLTEPIAYPFVLWALWATWRTCLRPGIGGDALALGAVGLATYARTGTVVLFGMPPVAAALYQLAVERDRRGPGLLAGRWARGLVRDHLLLALALAGGAALVLLSSLGLDPLPGVFGTYTTDVASLDWSPVPARLAKETSRLVTGTGLLPAVLALPWLVARAGRGGPGPEKAFALTGTLGFVLLLVATMYSSLEERYVAAAAPIILVAAIVVLARRDVARIGLVVSGVLVGLLVWRVPWPLASDPSEFQVDAARTFFTRVVLGTLSTPLPGSPQAAVALVAVLLGVAAAIVVRLRSHVAGAVVVAAAVALFAVQAVQTSYVTFKRAAMTQGVPLRDRLWVDRAAHGRRVALFSDGISNAADYTPTWGEVSFYNASTKATVSRAGFISSLLPRDDVLVRVRIDRRTGLLVPVEHPPIPRLWVIPTLFRPYAIAGERRIAVSSYLPAQLIEVPAPTRAAYLWDGPQQDGYIAADTTVKLRVFPGRGRRCATVVGLVPPNARRHRLTLVSGRERRTAVASATHLATVTVPVPERGATVQVRTRGSVEIFGGRKVSFQIANTVIGRCR